jgi:predicted nucleotidyltransferase component of viral defense system
VLDPVEAAAVAEQFAVSDEQVRRDHLISHLLAALARAMPEAVIFFGGTALARTHLPHGRLSEDLDLFAVPRRTDVVGDVERLLAIGVRRGYAGWNGTHHCRQYEQWTPPYCAPQTGSPSGSNYSTHQATPPGRPSAVR